MPIKQENLGVIFALIAAAEWGVFPVLVNKGTQNIPPLMFAAVTTLLAAVGFLIYTALKVNLHELRNRNSYKSLIMVTLCIVIVPYTLFFVGSSKTSGLNSSLLLLSEIIFTLVFTHFIGEKTTIMKLVGALGVFVGALLILNNGKSQLNVGDLLVILSTATYPVGNFYAKKALNFVSSSTILLVRFLLGGFFILITSLFFEPQSNIFQPIIANWGLILFTGLILLGVGKIIWYEGLKRLDISKAVSLAMSFPLFSLLVLMVFFKETPSLLQWLGIIMMAIGVFFSIKRVSVNSALTKYRS